MTKERMTIDYENDGDFEYDKNKYKTITTRIKSIEPSEGWLEPSGSVGHINTIPEAGDVHVDEHEDRGSSIDDDSRTYLLYSTETRRKLENRHVQLIAISGVIGTALFVAIGKALYRGGPASLLLAFALWCVPILCITVSTAEMVCFFPVSSPFLRLATKCVDDSLAVMASWNFWFLECVQIPFEIVSVNTIIHYWRDDYSAGVPLAVQVVLYLLISICAVKYYGEMEFWLASFKIILALGLFTFTFITMLGGNPEHDRYGFRNYGESPFKKYFPDGNDVGKSSGYFQGFLACLIQASFTIAGGEYISMLAGEVKRPRKVLPKAFKQVFVRLTFLFLGSCLCVGIVCSPNDPDLTAAINEARPGAGSSPYVIAMNNLKIRILPDIVNIALITAAFSAGNAYTYCSSRTFYGMALDGYAPKIFTRCNRHGVPIYSVAISLVWALVSLLQLNSNSAVVLNWLINLITASQLINFVVLCIVYLFFRRAYHVQQDSLPKLPFRSWGQPYTAIIGLVSCSAMILIQGYTVFFPKLWNTQDFLFSYLMVFINIGIYVGYKFVWKRGKDHFKNPHEIDFSKELTEIENHEIESSFEKFQYYSKA
ncbi:CNT_collapsed_G0003320.mRNA.1.CDS.1 [Saccharomyces cerevisiae]|nr:CNT_HP1_G0003180.mRNA.1.CDS.1 [Saccharomyces cerevisiae]CAI7150764.1 CNT_collapsed_G0003320.mRNA.1.CDS.1 [Saccharomyces cerevisiae]